ncbi:MAG: exopolysaccharide biosynthesis polyprenyl glycosylphosphotransferase [Prevotella sp.]
MTNKNSREFVYFTTPVFIMDLGIHLLVLTCISKLMPSSYFPELLKGDNMSLSVYILLTIAYTMSIGVFGLRLHERQIKLLLVLWRAMVQTVATYLLFTVLVTLVLKASPRTMIMTQLCVSLPLIVVFHYCANVMVRRLRRLRHNMRNVVILGTDEVSIDLYGELIQGQAFRGYKVLGFFGPKEGVEVPEGSKIIGDISYFFEWIKRNSPDEIYCSLPPAEHGKVVNRIIHICNERFIELFFVPNFKGYPKRHMLIRSIGDVKYIKLHEEPMNSPTAKLMKRTVDIFVSGLFLCTLYPFVVLFVWLGNLITGNVGPLYFRQARTGYNGKRFYIYKFRSMKENKDADKLQATKDDPRKTPFGDFLRRSSIDELPQFINVFLGNMSIIGPRPHMEYHTDMYSALIGDYMVRHLAKPGITGWAQINGCRGETKTLEEMANRVEHDIWYIENWSPLLDIEIFFKTIWQVMPGRDKQAY